MFFCLLQLIQKGFAAYLCTVGRFVQVLLAFGEEQILPLKGGSFSQLSPNSFISCLCKNDILVLEA